MTYLSRVQIDSFNQVKMSKLTSVNQYHSWVENVFPENIKNHTRPRHLWRIDRIAGKNYLMILSNEEPNVSELESNGIKGTAKVLDYNKFLDSIQENGTYRFKLTANPTVKIKKNIVPCKKDETQMEWLSHKAEINGFSLNQVVVTEKRREYLHKFKTYEDENGKTKRKNVTVPLEVATYEGYLTVTDTEKFKKALIGGFGREKAFGVGLMTVMPVR